MVDWIKKIALILGISVFFLLLIIGIAGAGEYTLHSLSVAFIRAFFGASLAWVVGIIIADILLKGMVSDIENDRSALMEGGLMQRLQSLRGAVTPGSQDMPFSGITAIGKKQNNERQSSL